MLPIWGYRPTNFDKVPLPGITGGSCVEGSTTFKSGGLASIRQNICRPKIQRRHLFRFNNISSLLSNKGHTNDRNKFAVFQKHLAHIWFLCDSMYIYYIVMHSPAIWSTWKNTWCQASKSDMSSSCEFTKRVEQNSCWTAGVASLPLATGQTCF